MSRAAAVDSATTRRLQRKFRRVLTAGHDLVLFERLLDLWGEEAPIDAAEWYDTIRSTGALVLDDYRERAAGGEG